LDRCGFLTERANDEALNPIARNSDQVGEYGCVEAWNAHSMARSNINEGVEECAAGALNGILFKTVEKFLNVGL
jgi:hypothetical protein